VQLENAREQEEILCALLAMLPLYEFQFTPPTKEDQSTTIVEDQYNVYEYPWSTL
jgi:hypothetical protein